MKKKLFLLIILFALAIFSAHSAFAATSSFANPLGQNMGTVDKVLLSTFGYLSTVAGTIGVIFIIIGGIVYMMSAGNEEMAELGKRIVTASAIGVAIVVAAPVFGQEIILIVEGNPSQVATSSGIAKIAMNVLRLLMAIVGSLAIISLLIGGIMMFTAAGDDKQLETAKKVAYYSIIGIVVSLGALVISKQIIQLLGG